MPEPPTNTILAGVDGSQHCVDAMALATALASPLRATALAAYVHPYGDSDRAMSDSLYRDALAELDRFVCAHMDERGAPLRERRMTVIADRSPARGLGREAERRRSALIVLGASHRSQLGRVFLGDTAERLLSGSPCPVAIAPKGYSERPGDLATIGCAFDGSPESRAALAWTKAFASAAGSDVRILTVHKPQVLAIPAFYGFPAIARDEAMQRDLGRRLAVATREVQADGIGAEGLMLEGRPASLLQEQSTDLDLLVTGSRGYGPSRALLGSVSRALVHNASCPVVVMPRGSDELPSGMPEASCTTRC